MYNEKDLDNDEKEIEHLWNASIITPPKYLGNKND
jgi:hypothetical protein